MLTVCSISLVKIIWSAIFAKINKIDEADNYPACMEIGKS